MRVCLLFAGVVACTSGELTRFHAARELATRFTRGSVGTVRVYRSKCVEKYFERYPIRFLEDAQLARQYQLLEAAGLATVQTRPASTAQCGTAYSESLRIIGIVLTPKGEAEDWPEHDDGVGGWDIDLGLRAFMDVTAIVPQPAPLLARVEYRWRVIPTVGGAALGQTTVPRVDTATFQRDETGWHLSRSRSPWAPLP